MTSVVQVLLSNGFTRLILQQENIVHQGGARNQLLKYADKAISHASQLYATLLHVLAVCTFNR